MAKSSHPPSPSSPAAPVHPMTGGAAPGIAPMRVASELLRFIGV